MSPIQTLQVFNSGKPCGWLGQSQRGYWFHYASNNPQQYWVSLLMPPSQNFYQQTELFPVFAQYGSSLAELHQRNGTLLGALSFANPDNPVVKPPLREPPALLPRQTALVMTSSITQVRRNLPDTLVHHECVWPLVQHLQTIKKKADPNNRLQALQWTQEVKCVKDFLLHPRPDIDTYRQQLLGFESLCAILNVSNQQYLALTRNPHKLALLLTEVARTYCKNPKAEMELIQQLLPLLRTGNIQAHLVYSLGGQLENAHQPTVLGFEYLPVN